MCTENHQDDEKKPLSAYIMVAAVAIVTLWLVYLVNVELLPFIFDIDREVYRQALVNLGAQTTTTAIGVFVGMLCFYAVFQPHKLGVGESQPDSAQKAQGDNCEKEQRSSDTE
jgi:hypothetical protein